MKLKGENSDTCANWNLPISDDTQNESDLLSPPFGATETAYDLPLNISERRQHPFDVTFKCLAFSLRLRFGFCYRVFCYLRLKVLSSDSVGESCVMRGKGTCKLSLWWYYIIIYMYAMYMQCITLWLIDYVEVMYAEYSCSVNNVQFAIKDSFHKRTYSITCDQKLAARSQRHTAARTISKEHLGVKRHRPLWRTASDLFKGVSIICRVCRLVMCDGFMKSRSTYPGKHQT